MKLLLTSSGITNQSIAQALFDLVGKKAEETSVAFIPTAANVDVESDEWLANDVKNIKKQNFHSVEIIDISKVSREIWEPKFEEADVLFFGGGDTYHLMEWMNKSGLSEILPELLQTRVYAGISAGSMLTHTKLGLELSQKLYDEDLNRIEEMNGLNFVDFYFLPHLNSKWFSKVNEENIKEAVKNTKEKVYALDDQSALKVVDGNVEVISEGKYLVFNG